MKVAVCAHGEGQDAAVDSRFGRCRFFVIIDEGAGSSESVANGALAAGGGAGSQAARFLSERGVDVVLVGNVGPNAATVLEAAGIEVYTGAEGTVRETVDLYRRGKMKRALAPTVPSHFGFRAQDPGGSGMGSSGRDEGRR